jgi:hypothetical protein
LSTRFPAVGSTAAGTSVVAGRGLFLVFFSLAAASSLAGAPSARGEGAGSLGGAGGETGSAAGGDGGLDAGGGATGTMGAG